ncbi:MAG: amidophosphoribosyltransferase [Erythrobacter sp. 34-65-8]|nr:MAG: amidophosphoribosyltransferase [Erythrobacter sp. 34-65-8]
MRESLAPLVDLVFPPRCPLCGEGIGQQTGLCAACWSTLVIPAAPLCSRCQRPLPESAGEGDAQCAPCMAHAPRHDGIAAGTLYNGPSRKLVLAFKHGGRIALAPLMAGLIASRLPGLEGEWLFVPVPLHRWRLWRRGYNQAALLARALAQRTGQPVLVDGLLRTRPTPVLGGLGKQERKRALAGALVVNPLRRASIRGARIVLVDDVLTSGATTDACVAALQKAGAKSVVIACFARVLDEALPFTE